MFILVEKCSKRSPPWTVLKTKQFKFNYPFKLIPTLVSCVLTDRLIPNYQSKALCSKTPSHLCVDYTYLVAVLAEKPRWTAVLAELSLQAWRTLALTSHVITCCSVLTGAQPVTVVTKRALVRKTNTVAMTLVQRSVCLCPSRIRDLKFNV